MTHREKVQAFHQHMQAVGVSPLSADPPLWRLLRLCGLELAPPPFQPFAWNALLMGGFFGVGWGLLMWLVMWWMQGMPLTRMVAPALTAGLLFGVFMAVFYARLARKHRLPGWEEYTGIAQERVRS